MKALNHALVLLVALAASSAQAGTINLFKKSTNDGVYIINEDQAAYLGLDATADRVGFLRIREGNGVSFGIGDTFNQSTIFNSTNNDSKILGLFNGDNLNLGYTGGFLDSLGLTTLNSDDSGFFRGVLFAFSSTGGNIVFNGTSTFSAGNNRGLADFIPVAQVPEPGSLALLGLGLAAMGLRRKQRH